MLKPRLQAALVGVIIGAVVVSGVAYAAVHVVPNLDPSSTDRYYACVSAAARVKPATIKLNVQPSGCTSATDTIRSWNAQGPAGPLGAPAPTLAASGTTSVSPGDWSDPLSTHRIDSDEDQRVLVRLSASGYCVGQLESADDTLQGRINIDGSELGRGYLVPITASGGYHGFSGSGLVEAVSPRLPAGSHEVTTHVRVPTGFGAPNCYDVRWNVIVQDVG